MNNLVLRLAALLISAPLISTVCISQGHAAPGEDKRWQNAYSYSQEEVLESQTGLSGSWSEKVEEIMIRALSLTGVGYKYGGRSPETGFDCSGFVQYVFKHAAQISLPPSARTISELGDTVKRDDLQPGDLVFFNTLKSAFSHVGIYVGNNQFIHAPRAGAKVRVENMDERYWRTRYNGAKRMEVETGN
ncbi:MAG: C40 family peptidase [Methylophilus sp.]|nr:C40 family peptidase [Methylophilus sp.]